MKPALLVSAFLAALACAATARALDEEVVARLGSEDVGVRLEAINALVASGDEAAPALLQAMQDGQVKLTLSGRVVVVRGDRVFNAATMAPIEPAPEGLEGIVVNNRIRGALDTAIGALKLLSPDRAVRLASAKAIEATSQAALLPLIEKAIARESDPGIRKSLQQTKAALDLKNADPGTRLAAVSALGGALGWLLSPAIGPSR